MEHQSLRASLDAVTRAGNAPAFPGARVALVVAVVAGASPYLTRPWRRVNAALIAALVMAGMYLGVGYPDDLVAGVVLGWGVAAGVHLLFGSPGGHPTIEQVTASLAELGVAATGVRLAPQQPPVATIFLAEDDDGPLRVKVLGRDETDAQLLSKMLRFVLYKDSGPVFFWTRLGQLQHEAYALLLAREGGTRAPPVLIAGTAGPGVALLVTHTADGTRMSDAEPGELTDPVLDELWAQVAGMHAARVAHGELNAAHVVLGPDGPTLVDFRLAFWSLLAANIFLGTIASLIPIPGGGTAVASVGLSGALVAFGVPSEVAVAAVLANQLVLNYLPAVPGWLATTHLVRRGYV